MKKALSLILALVLCLSLCACGGTEEAKTESVALTTANISQYLKVNATVEECNFDEGEMGSGFYLGAEGDAKILIETINNSGAKFDGVTLTCEITVSGGFTCGWEFTKDNIRSEDEHSREDNSKIITIDLSYNGEGSVTENVKWVNYKGEWENQMLLVYDELDNSDVDIEIIEVTGLVEVEN